MLDVRFAACDAMVDEIEQFRLKLEFNAQKLHFLTVQRQSLPGDLTRLLTDRWSLFNDTVRDSYEQLRSSAGMKQDDFLEMVEDMYHYVRSLSVAVHGINALNNYLDYQDANADQETFVLTGSFLAALGRMEKSHDDFPQRRTEVFELRETLNEVSLAPNSFSMRLKVLESTALKGLIVIGNDIGFDEDGWNKAIARYLRGG